MRELKKGKRLSRAALAAGVDRKTAQRYIERGGVSQPHLAPRTWRTREDPFAEDRAWIEGALADVPELEAKALFRHLQDKRPDLYDDSTLRTFQRLVQRWRAQHGPEREVFFAQVHRAGEAMQTDFTWATELEVTICGEPFRHMLCHHVLPYSNWQWATVSMSESMLAIRQGLQSALAKLGRHPEFHQTDHSTAATHELGDGHRGFNQEYLALCSHYDIKPRTIGVGKCEQNGDIESANGALKRRLKQYLLLRGSRDFASVEAWEAFVQEACNRANALRSKRLCEELAVMKEVRVEPLPNWQELRVPVLSSSTIRVRENSYSVPSRLIGQTMQVRIGERTIQAWYAGTCELSTERLLGRGGARIDYRHIIFSLLRKPGAFARYRHRQELFPTLTFRRAFDALQAGLGDDRKADVEYLRLLHLAASTMQHDVEAAIELLLDAGSLPSSRACEALTRAPLAPSHPALCEPTVELAPYDRLLRYASELRG